MYVWIWRKLPGRWPAKLGGSFLLLLAALALLFFVIFPFAEPRLPFNKSTVTPGGAPVPSSPTTPVPTVSPTPVPSGSALPAD